jgi:uncharacterized protein
MDLNPEFSVRPEFIVKHEEELSALYDPAPQRSVLKQLDRLDAYCRDFIAASPMVIVGTQAQGAADNSPRGDVPGFVKVVDDHTLIIPDRRGNNRLDSLRNIVRNPLIGLLFLIPGVNETFRVNGEATVSRDPALTEQFAVQGKTPRTVIVVRVREAYIHCSRALVRAELWNPAKHVDRSAVPSFGTIMAKHTKGLVDAKTVDEEARTLVPHTLY